jgi:hypothetical protein
MSLQVGVGLGQREDHGFQRFFLLAQVLGFFGRSRRLDLPALRLLVRVSPTFYRSQRYLRSSASRVVRSASRAERALMRSASMMFFF